MKNYLKHIKPNIVFFILSPLLMLIEVYCDVKLPTIAGEVVNLAILPSNTNELSRLAMIMLVYIIVSLISGIVASYCASKASINFSCSLREDVFYKIQNFSFANIDKFSNGSLITRLTNDIYQLQQLVIMALRLMFRAPGMLVGSIAMAYMINGKITVIFLILVPILSFVTYLVLKYSHAKFDHLQQSVDGMNSKVREVLTNIRVIKAFTREEYEKDRFADVNGELKDSGISAYKYSVIQMPIMTLVINFGTIAVVWFCSKLMVTGDIELGNITSFTTYLSQILMSINMMSMVFLQTSRAIASGKRVNQVMNEQIDIEDDKKSYAVVQNGDITFENVYFKYYKNNEEQVLKDINFSIKSGQTVGVIGSTGSGKTSLVHLIPRLYDVDCGKVFVGGRDVKGYSLKNLRDGVAVVLQSNLLFSGTIAENLRWGNKNASLDKLIEIASLAVADEFINTKPNKYDYYIEQGGVNLSGGQRQRMCIARAMLKDPKILIFDDSTSAVDTSTEGKIQRQLREKFKNATKIIIAQRISSVQESDMIIVLNDGCIEGCGTHEELLRNCPTYRDIYNSQASVEVIE